MLERYNSLNPKGQVKVAEYVEDLTKIPEYQAKIEKSEEIQLKIDKNGNLTE